jgi:prepilin-type N-terminal cleavage/methylation domain-containing protein
MPAHVGDRDDGVTLIEMLVTMSILVLLMGSVVGTVAAALRTQTRQVQQADALVDAQRAYDRMTREIRQANPVVAADPDSIQVEVTDAGVRRSTTYTLLPAASPGADREIRQTISKTVIATGATTTSTVSLLRGVHTSTAPFRYYERDGTELVGTVDPTRVDRIQVSMSMTLFRTTRTVDLSTSLSLRNRKA